MLNDSEMQSIREHNKNEHDSEQIPKKSGNRYEFTDPEILHQLKELASFKRINFLSIIAF